MHIMRSFDVDYEVSFSVDKTLNRHWIMMRFGTVHFISRFEPTINDFAFFVALLTV